MEGLKQSTLDFSKGQVRISSRSPSLDARPSPEIPSTNKHTKRKPVTQAFDHGKHRQQDGYVSDGQEVSESEEEAKLETTSRGRKQVKVSSDEDQSQSGTEDEESEEMDSEEMMDLEASDDEDYQSGDSLDEDEGGNRRRKKKDKGKGKRKRRESTDESVEVIEPKKKVDKGKRRKIVESDQDDVEIVEQPVASTSVSTYHCFSSVGTELIHRHTRSALPLRKLPFPLLAQSLNEPALSRASSESLSHLEGTRRVPRLLPYPAHQSSRTAGAQNRNLRRQPTVKNPIPNLHDSLPPVRGRVKVRNEL